MQLARIGAWVETLGKCQEQSEKYDALRLNMYADKLTSLVSKEVNRLIQEVYEVLVIRESKELWWPSKITECDSVENE